MSKKLYILKLESYYGEYSSLLCDSEGNNFMYCICVIQDGKVEIVDYGYKSIEEAERLWPEVIRIKKCIKHSGNVQ